MRVCVFCSSSEEIALCHQELAELVGAELARRGHDLVSGGGRVSMMGAVAGAVRAGGRHTLGVIPQAMIPWEVADGEADELVVTSDMRERKGRMDAAADAFLALPGGLGTLEELFEVWTARSLVLHDRPVVVLDPTGVYRGLRELVERLCREGFVRPAALVAITWTDCLADAFRALEAGVQPCAPPGGEVTVPDGVPLPWPNVRP